MSGYDAKALTLKANGRAVAVWVMLVLPGGGLSMGTITGSPTLCNCKLHGFIARGLRREAVALRRAALVNFPSIYYRFSRSGDAEARAVAPDGNEGDTDIFVNDDLLTYFACEHKHSSPPSGKKRREVSVPVCCRA
jgi:hypothetical protein